MVGAVERSSVTFFSGAAQAATPCQLAGPSIPAVQGIRMSSSVT